MYFSGTYTLNGFETDRFQDSNAYIRYLDFYVHRHYAIVQRTKTKRL